MNAEQLRVKLNYANKRVAFAWAKYYAEVNRELVEDRRHWILYTTVSTPSDDVKIPEHIKEEMKAMATALKKKWECPCCMEFIADDALEITNCGHYYCKECLAQWKATEKARGAEKWKCGMCNRKHKFKEDDE
jgi:ubiquitin C-terminal hydrolase